LSIAQPARDGIAHLDHVFTSLTLASESWEMWIIPSLPGEGSPTKAPIGNHPGDRAANCSPSLIRRVSPSMIPLGFLGGGAVVGAI